MSENNKIYVTTSSQTISANVKVDNSGYFTEKAQQYAEQSEASAQKSQANVDRLLANEDFINVSQNLDLIVEAGQKIEGIDLEAILNAEASAKASSESALASANLSEENAQTTTTNAQLSKTYRDECEDFSKTSKGYMDNTNYYYNEVNSLTGACENYYKEANTEANLAWAYSIDASISETNALKYSNNAKTSETNALKYSNNAKGYLDEVKEIVPNNFTPVPIGTIIPISASSVYTPTGTLSCDGAEYSKADFEQLWDNYLIGQDVLDPDSITVVGSPMITDDGVVSGFSSQDYIETTSIDFSKNFNIKFAFTTPTEADTTTTIRSVLGGTRKYSFQFIYSFITGGLHINLSSGERTDTWDIADKKLIEIPLNTKCYCHFIKDGNIYRFCYSFDGEKFTEVEIIQSPKTIYASPIYLGTAFSFWNGQRAWSGSIDLKKFSITVEGQTVFDCVLDGDYTVNDLVGKQGNPTIRKGKAYNFTNADYLHFNSDFLVNNGYGLVIKLRLPSVISKQYFCTYRGIDSNGRIGYPTGAGTGSSIQGIPSSNLYFRILGFAKQNTDLIFNYQISTDGKTWLGDESAKNYGYYASGFSIGADNYWSSETKQAFSGSVDLTESYLFKNTPDEKIYLCDVIYNSKRNTCSYGTYEKELKEYGQCGKFAVKPLEYDGSGLTIVGSPTITEDGVASGLNKTNYITLPSIDVNALKWKLQGRIKPILAPNNTFYITNLYLNVKGFTLYRESTGGIVIDIVINVDSVETRFKINTPVQWELGKAYDFFIQRDNGIFSFGSKEENELNYTVRQSEDKGNYPLADGTINLMQSYDTNEAEFDLKQFKIEVDGQTVFDCVEGGTFKVPTIENTELGLKNFVVVSNGTVDDCLATWNTLVELENYLKGV